MYLHFHGRAKLIKRHQCECQATMKRFVLKYTMPAVHYQTATIKLASGQTKRKTTEVGSSLVCGNRAGQQGGGRISSVLTRLNALPRVPVEGSHVTCAHFKCAPKFCRILSFVEDVCLCAPDPVSM